MISGHVIMTTDECNKNVDIRVVPRNVYDEIIGNSTL